MAETPKERFLEEFVKLVNKFEVETGVEVFGISIRRMGCREVQDIGPQSVIGSIEMDLK